MNPKAWLFLLFLTIISDIIACSIGSWFLWRRRESSPFAKYFAMLYFGLFLNGVFGLLANMQPVHAERSVWYACWFWVGRTCQSAGVWTSILFFLGYVNGKPEDSHE